ncbi:MAG: AAA family ATPase [Novosphingobium sp.]
MTDQTKIPLPPRDKSSVERASQGLDLAKLGGMPIPAELIPPRRVPRKMTPAESQEASGVSAPAPAPAPAPQAAAPESPRFERIDPRAEVPAAAPAARAAAPAIPVETVTFKGPRHKVDRLLLRQQGMIQPEGGVSGLLEEFRIVKRQLLLQAKELSRGGMGTAAQRILVCSPLPGEGKTYTSVNLALSIAAEKESEVVLVDADFAKPSILSTLGLPGGKGLMDALTDPSIDVADCVIGTDVSGLWVLPAGTMTNNDTEHLASSHTAQVLDRLVQGAPNRIVIFDSPPALAASPAAELAKYVGQAVLVARCDRTGQGSLEDAITLLSACPNIQLLLNGVHFSPSGRRFGSYYGYRG